ncbi:MAG TPA: hypothetical protein VFH47_00590 [Candidatus Thermoplasmatota archaeon]|nr:hypothetical protein [Candidatus Thermoplasmatota archaeon]
MRAIHRPRRHAAFTLLAALAVLAPATLAGCSEGKKDWFLPASQLPEGWTYAYGPREADAGEKARFGDAAEQVRVAGLQGPSGGTGAIVVVRFNEESAAERAANAANCDGMQLYHILRSGDTVAFLGIGGSGAAANEARAAMDDVARKMASRTGARQAC